MLRGAPADRPAATARKFFARQEIRFAGQTVKAAVRDTARDALVNGRWDAIGELIEGMPSVAATAARLPYLAA